VQHFGDGILDMAVALFGSALAAAFAAVLGIIGSMFLGRLLRDVGMLTDEGAAWSGISLGIPIGAVLAIIAFIYTFRRIRRYGEPE